MKFLVCCASESSSWNAFSRKRKSFFQWIWKLRIDFFFYSSSYSWMTGHTNQWWRRFERTKTFYLANKNAAALNSGRCWDQQGVCVVGRLSREGPFLWDKSVCVFSQTSIHTLAISPVINPSSITPSTHPSIHAYMHKFLGRATRLEVNRNGCFKGWNQLLSGRHVTTCPVWHHKGPFSAEEAERSKGWTCPMSLWRPPTEHSHVIFRKH